MKNRNYKKHSPKKRNRIDAQAKMEISLYRKQVREFRKPIKPRCLPPVRIINYGFCIEIFFPETFTRRKFDNFLRRAKQSMNEFLESFNAKAREFYEKNRLNFTKNDIV